METVAVDWNARTAAWAVETALPAAAWIIFDADLVSEVIDETATEDDCVVWRTRATASRASACRGMPTIRARSAVKVAGTERRRKEVGFADASTVTAGAKGRKKTDCILSAGSEDPNALIDLPVPRVTLAN